MSISEKPTGKKVKEKSGLRTKFDRFRQEEQVALGMIRASGKRPLTAKDVWTIQECERWRTAVVTEIIGRVERIADRKLNLLTLATMEDGKVRDMNDLINKSFREKRMWEMRVKELGGPDYGSNVLNDMNMGGVTVPGTKGYRYFGRAKHLDGVKELFEQAAILQEKVTPQELQQRADAEYFGYRDEDDGLLLKYEKKLEDSRNLSSPHVDYLPPKKVPTQGEFEAWMVRKRQLELTAKYLPVV